MSTEIINYDSAQAALAAYQSGATAAQAWLADLDPSALVPTVKLSKESKRYTLRLGDEELTGEPPKYVAFVGLWASRALWPPQGGRADGAAVLPVCRTALGTPMDFQPGHDTAVGSWSSETFDPPQAGQRHPACAGCPWNSFDSLQLWDRSREGSRSKACQEARSTFLLPMGLPGPVDRGTGVPYFDHDGRFSSLGNPHGLLRLQVSYATHRKAWRALTLAATARGVPLPAAVFEVEVQHQRVGAGAFVVAVFTGRFAGFVSRATWEQVAVEAAPQWATDFVGRFRERLETDTVAVEGTVLSDSSQSSASSAVASDEIPF